MANKIRKTQFTAASEQILLECLVSIQQSIRDYQRDITETLEEVKFTLSSENDSSFR